jgi:ketosteroid isomerase-like protein
MMLARESRNGALGSRRLSNQHIVLVAVATAFQRVSVQQREGGPMKHAIAFVPIVLAIVTSSAVGGATNSATASPADARQQVLDLEKRWAAAEDKHDAATIRRILDDKFVATFGAHAPYDKESFIKDELAGDVDPTQSQTLNEKAIIDGDTAIVVGTDTLRGTRKGKPYSEVARYTVTYILRHGQWYAIAEQLVDVPPAR